MNFVVDEASQGNRLDIFATEQLPELSRSYLKRLIDDSKLTVNGEQQKAGYKLRFGDKIAIDYDRDHLSVIPDIAIPILYEDNDCLVVDKPTGVLSHSKGAFNPEATVATFISSKIMNMDGDRAGIVHRLDRATSGVMICAKTPEALTWLQRQFSSRKVKKTYFAVVEGSLEPPKAIVDVPIERNPRNPKTFRAGSGGKVATTQYEVTESINGYSLVKLLPQTGRTHQLRVHLKYLKHPIVGDPIYGGVPSNRMLLHASTLELTLPNGQRKVFESKLPKEFSAILKA